MRLILKHTPLEGHSSLKYWLKKLNYSLKNCKSISKHCRDKMLYFSTRKVNCENKSSGFSWHHVYCLKIIGLWHKNKKSSWILFHFINTWLLTAVVIQLWNLASIYENLSLVMENLVLTSAFLLASIKLTALKLQHEYKQILTLFFIRNCCIFFKCKFLLKLCALEKLK